jgi:hypothetical protein
MVAGLLAAISGLWLVLMYLPLERKNEIGKSPSRTEIKTGASDGGDQRGASSLAHLEWLAEEFNKEYVRASNSSKEPRFEEYHEELNDFLNDARILHEYARTRYREALGKKDHDEAFMYSVVDGQAGASVGQMADVLAEIQQESETVMLENNRRWQDKLEPQISKWRRVLSAYSADSASISKYAEDPEDLSRLLQKGSSKLSHSRALSIQEDTLGAWIAVAHASLLIDSAGDRLLGFYTDIYGREQPNNP